MTDEVLPYPQRLAVRRGKALSKNKLYSGLLNRSLRGRLAPAESERHLLILLSQLAELCVLREHRHAFAVEDSLELRRPDAVAPSTQGATGVPPVASLQPVAAYRTLNPQLIATTFRRMS